MEKAITPAVKRIMDIASNEIEKAMSCEFATLEEVGKSYNELCHNMSERLNKMKEAKGLFTSDEWEDTREYVKIKLSAMYSDAMQRTRQRLRNEYEF